MASIIQVNNLSKKYGSFEAVKNISFEVESNSLYAFLGPNGAGKSTTINILSTLITQNSGHVLINNWKLHWIFKWNVYSNWPVRRINTKSFETIALFTYCLSF